MLEELEKELDGEAEHVRRRLWEGGARRISEGELPDHTPLGTTRCRVWRIDSRLCPKSGCSSTFFPSPFRCPKIVSSVISSSSPSQIPFFNLSNTKLFLGLFWTK